MITHFRIEPKLIQGPVKTRLLPLQRCHGILIIDDELATEPKMQRAILTTVSSYKSVYFYTVDLAAQKLEKAQQSAMDYCVFARYPSTIEQLIGNSYRPPCTVTGGQFVENPEGFLATPGIRLSEEEIDCFSSIVASGVSVVFDPNCNDENISWTKVLRAINKKQDWQGSDDTGKNTSLIKAFQILDHFLDDPSCELTVSEVQARVQLPVSTTYRLVSFLERNGYLVKSKQTKKYSLGWKFQAVFKQGRSSLLGPGSASDDA